MTFAERAIAYAQAVTKGEIDACRMVERACSRFLKDLERPEWEFKPDLVERVCGFAELMPHVKGKWARVRELIILQEWQIFILACLFGFVGPDGRRRFRQAYIMLPRKQGKSVLAAVIGLYMLVMDGEAGAEVYCGATSEAQAWEVFRPAKLMAEKAGADGPGEFLDEFGVTVAARSIFSTDGSRFQPVIGKPGDGSSPHCAIIDEYHEHDTPDQFDTMLTGMGAREQPLALVITTAGDNLGGPCYDMQRFAEDVLEGHIGDDGFFAIIYTIDKDDDWRDFSVWRKANPNLGVSVFEDFLLARHQEALNRPAKQGINLTKHLNVWVSSRDAWLNMADWQACAEPVTMEEMAGCEAWIGLDLATKIDVAAMVAKVRMADGRFAYLPFFYLPEAVVLEARSKNSAAYGGWAAAGHLTLTPGDATDFEFIAEDLRKLLRHLDVQAVGFDPYQAHHLAQQMQAEGAPMIEYPMQTRTLSPPMREMEAAVVSRMRVHPANPMFDWMASNVTAKEDGRGNVYPRKPHGQEHLKIDGITAALMAEGLSMKEEGSSVYEERGLLVFG